MLNSSPNNPSSIDGKQYVSYQEVAQECSTRRLRRGLYVIGLIFLVIMFLPWTQNIRSKGEIITLRPEQKPQTINTIIGGKIVKWYVKEGDLIKKGDTILVISEIKDGYFDPKLIDRTQNQIDNKEQSVVAYEQKIHSLDQRVDALIENSKLKIQQAQIKYRQARLKITTDSTEFEAAKLNFNIAKDQVNRFEKLLLKENIFGFSIFV